MKYNKQIYENQKCTSNFLENKAVPWYVKNAGLLCKCNMMYNYPKMQYWIDTLWNCQWEWFMLRFFSYKRKQRSTKVNITLFDYTVVQILEVQWSYWLKSSDYYYYTLNWHRTCCYNIFNITVWISNVFD